MICHGYGVKLRGLAPGEEGVLYRWRNDPKIRRWTRQADLLTWNQHLAWFEHHQMDPTVKMYAIEQGGTLMGVCGLTSIDWQNRRAEFSLYIGPEHQGEGRGKKALKTLLHHAFHTLGLNCVWGETMDGNTAAETFEKIGMKKEGSRRAFYFRDGGYLDAHLFSILHADWVGLLPAWEKEREPAPEEAPAEGAASITLSPAAISGAV